MPFSPLDTMEKLVNHDEDVAQYDSKPIIDAMKEGTFFNLYKHQNDRIIQERIFMYYRQDSTLGSLYFTAASPNICPPKREQPVPSGHTALSLKRLSDIWLGKQTDVLMHHDARNAPHAQCWTIFIEDGNHKMSLDLVSVMRVQWMIGYHACME